MDKILIKKLDNIILKIQELKIKNCDIKIQLIVLELNILKQLLHPLKPISRDDISFIGDSSSDEDE